MVMSMVCETTAVKLFCTLWQDMFSRGMFQNLSAWELVWTTPAMSNSCRCLSPVIENSLGSGWIQKWESSNGFWWAFGACRQSMLLCTCSKAPGMHVGWCTIFVRNRWTWCPVVHEFDSELRQTFQHVVGLVLSDEQWQQCALGIKEFRDRDLFCFTHSRCSIHRFQSSDI